MPVTHCINLCDANLPEPALPLERSISLLCTEAGFPSCDRIEIGSNFCTPELAHNQQEVRGELMDFCRRWDIPVSLAIPCTLQSRLGMEKHLVARLLEEHGDVIDEVVVNDLGTLEYISSTYKVNLSIGRLFSKDLRDPRYDQAFPQVYRPMLLEGKLARLKERYPRIVAAEFDPAGWTVDLVGAPEGVTPVLHAPYFYVTTGFICEAASAREGAHAGPMWRSMAENRRTDVQNAPSDLDKRFMRLRVDMPCGHRCTTAMTTYRVHPTIPGTLQDDPSRELYFTKRGKTVYCLNDGVRVLGADDPAFAYRISYTPRHFGWSAQQAAQSCAFGPAFQGGAW